MEQQAVRRNTKVPAVRPQAQGPGRRGISPRTKKILAVSAIGAALLAMVAVFWFVGRPLIEFVSQPEQFRAWVQGHGIWGKLAFVGMMALQIIIAFIPGEPLEIGAGYAFGVWEGTLLCLLGAVLGSAIVFLCVRRFGVKLVEIFFPIEKVRQLRFLRDTKRLTVTLFFIFLIPGTPKDLLAYVVGLTNLKFLPWMLITGVARFPSVITSTIGGDALGMQNYQFAIVVFVITILLSAGGLLAYRQYCKRQDKKTALEEKE